MSVLPGDELLEWREEAFGEHPVLGPWGDPFHGPGSDEPLVCGLENPEVCESFTVWGLGRLLQSLFD